jgi:hypothetical protein
MQQVAAAMLPSLWDFFVQFLWAMYLLHGDWHYHGNASTAPSKHGPRGHHKQWFFM